MELEKIQQLIELVKKHQLSELKLIEGDSQVCINSNVGMHAAPASVSAYPIPTPVYTNPLSPPVSASEESVQGHVIRSPIVGTAYLAPKPDAAPFVEVGKSVKPGDVLCIIEAMKMMNHIESDKTGVVKKILIKNAQPVEYNQDLFIIE